MFKSKIDNSAPEYIIVNMTFPEITPFGESSFDARSVPNGTLYRYSGAEHFCVQKGEGDEGSYEHVDFSTQYGPEAVRETYEIVFGTAAEIEPDEELDSTWDTAAEYMGEAASEVSFSFGPAFEIIVENADFQLGWLSPAPVFDDREEETARVTVSQNRGTMDFRHKELIRLLADPNVVRDLDTLFP